MQEKISPAKQRNGRAYLLTIIGICIVPLIVAWIMVKNWQPDASVNKGELLTPALAAEHWQIEQPNGEIASLTELRGRWTLVYLHGAGECSESCQQSLYMLRQLRLSLAKEMKRVQRYGLLAEPPPSDFAEVLAQEKPNLIVGVPDAQTRDWLLKAFPVNAAPGWIYLIDPNGNLVLRYAHDQNPAELKGDLKRLLKYSKIG